MPLTFPAEWKFATSDEVPAIPDRVASQFWQLLLDIAASSPDPWSVVEGFKSRFGENTSSSDASWAQSDLSKAMFRRAKNAVRFLESLWLSLEDATAARLATPTETQLNNRLRANDIPYEIRDATLYQAIVDAAVATAPPIEPSPLGQARLRYELGEEIGHGGFGVVHRATRETSAATFEFAMKILNPSAFIADREKAFARFQREVRAVQSLQHRALVSYVDAGVDHEGRPYLVMPYINGRNIRDATEGRDVPAIVELMADVLFGLEHAHSHGVIHRDLKPSNILVRASDNQPVVVDFGAAYVLDDLDKKSLTTAAVGSIGYMPQEVLDDPKIRSVGHDVYSCAVIIYELIARQRPKPRQYVALAHQRRELARLDDLIVRALGAPDERPVSAGVFRNELLAAISQS